MDRDPSQDSAPSRTWIPAEGSVDAPLILAAEGSERANHSWYSIDIMTAPATSADNSNLRR